MKLLLSRPRGFCAGVKRAIATVKEALAIWGAPVYVKHEIVHNRHVVDELKQLGALFIEDLSCVPTGSRLIFSAHGVSPELREEAKRRNLQIIDATCGLVTKIHSAVKRFAARGYKVVLIGHRTHVEVIGAAGEAPSSTTVIETVQDVEKLLFSADQKIAYLTQTTLSLADAEEIIAALKRRYPSIETMPSSSICYATQNRQAALRMIAKNADIVIVVGDSKSSNSNRLRETAQKEGKNAFLVDCASTIRKEWFVDVRVIAMTAGASTPEFVVQECVEQLKEFGVSEVEEIVYQEENIMFQLPNGIRRDDPVRTLLSKAQ